MTKIEFLCVPICSNAPIALETSNIHSNKSRSSCQAHSLHTVPTVGRCDKPPQMACPPGPTRCPVRDSTQHQAPTDRGSTPSCQRRVDRHAIACLVDRFRFRGLSHLRAAFELRQCPSGALCRTGTDLWFRPFLDGAHSFFHIAEVQTGWICCAPCSVGARSPIFCQRCPELPKLWEPM